MKNLHETNTDRNYFIEYILSHNMKIKREVLQSLKFESLVMIKVQIELELAFKTEGNK